MANYADKRFLDVWYSRIDIDEVTRVFDAMQPKSAVQRRRHDIAAAHRRTSLRAFLRMCEEVDGQYRIRPAHPVIIRYPIERHPAVLKELRHAVALYQETLRPDRREVLRRSYLGDFARKVVGVGSVGTEAFVLLLLGDRADEPLFLQLKEAQESVLAPYAGPSEYKHQGERVVQGQRLTQAAPDPFLPRLRPNREGVADRRLPRRPRNVRPGARRLRTRLRQPEREGLPSAARRHILRTDSGDP
ncbi:MAG TPA: DUF2252 family protein [Jatrophihabitantaceae bacterium]